MRISFESVKRAASGQWPQILQSLGGLTPEQCEPINQPCPACGGDDRYNVCRKSFAEKGTVFCNQHCDLDGCDGFGVLQHQNGWDAKTVLRKVAEFLSIPTESSGTPQATQSGQTSQKAKPIRPARQAKPTKPSKRDAARPQPLSDLIAYWKSSVTGQPVTASHEYRYPMADGSDFAFAMRFDLADGTKQFRQASFERGGWIGFGPLDGRPLFNIVDVQAADEIILVEGEKAAIAASGFGVATTNLGGSNATAKTDWSSLDGKTVYIWRDHDSAGEKWQNKVIDAISQQAPDAKLYEIEPLEIWPDMPEKGDCFDWCEHHDSADSSWLLDQVKQAAVRVTPYRPADAEPEWMPFPLDSLPLELLEYVNTAAKVFSVDPASVAAPLLCMFSTAIAGARELELTPDWRAPCILWLALVGEAGTGKSPAWRPLTEPLKRENERLADQFDASFAAFKRLHRQWQADSRKAMSKGQQLSDEPIQPLQRSATVDSVTTAALTRRLIACPRGVGIIAEELSRMLAEIDKFGSTASGNSETAYYLSCYDAGSYTAGRAGSDTDKLLSDMRCSLAGTIQPKILAKAMNENMETGGFLARLRTIRSPTKRRVYDPTVSMPKAMKSRYSELINSMLALQPAEVTRKKCTPKTLQLSRDGKYAFNQWFESIEDAKRDSNDDLYVAQLAKIAELPGRISIVLHELENVDVPDAFGSKDEVTESTMGRAIQIAEWLRHEQFRCNYLAKLDEEQETLRSLDQYCQKHGGRMSARKLGRNRRAIGTSAMAQIQLQQLIDAGYGKWVYEGQAELYQSHEKGK